MRVGRWGVRVGNSPRSPQGSRGDRTWTPKPRLRWNTNTHQMRSKSARPTSAASKSWSGRSSMRAGNIASPLTCAVIGGWRGVPNRSVYGERTTPIAAQVKGCR